jgi:hypothetical protein
VCDPQRHEGLLALYDEASHDLRTFRRAFLDILEGTLN